MAETIRLAPIDDGREEDCQCARCGTSAFHVDCYDCENGYSHHDCGEDCCCCLNPEPNVPCDVCGGSGGWWQCCSPGNYCEANPIPGREHIQRGAIEWYDVPARAES
jgi:hypothetical protein